MEVKVFVNKLRLVTEKTEETKRERKMLALWIMGCFCLQKLKLSVLWYTIPDGVQKKGKFEFVLFVFWFLF